ncbi:MAG: hypothetical protein AAF892_17680 [Cyanobacteria bacterium P01_D01_bin.71]
MAMAVSNCTIHLRLLSLRRLPERHCDLHNGASKSLRRSRHFLMDWETSFDFTAGKA